MAHITQNAGYSFDTCASDTVSGTSPSYAGVTHNGGGKRKKRKQMRTKKKRGASKRKNKKVSTLRKKRGSSKRKNRGSFKRRKHSKREVVQSIMKGLGEKRKSRKKSMKRGGDNDLVVQQLKGEIMMLGSPTDRIDAEKCEKKWRKKKCLRKIIDRREPSHKSEGPSTRERLGNWKEQRRIDSDLTAYRSNMTKRPSKLGRWWEDFKEDFKHDREEKSELKKQEKQAKKSKKESEAARERALRDWRNNPSAF